MQNKTIKKLYNSKIELIKKYNKSYYSKNKSVVSDQEYDELKKEINIKEDNFD